MITSNEIAGRLAPGMTLGETRWIRIRTLLIAAFANVSRTAAHWLARYHESRRVQAAQYAVRHLNDHLLRDIGLEREACYQPEENYDVYRC
jgi:uncharacterized protein YjiS (DUF1127 family)